MSNNDNHSPALANGGAPDAQAQAALLLIESLIHGLIDRSILTLEQGIEIVQTAVDVQIDVAQAADGAGAPMWHAHALMLRMLDSLRIDMSNP